MSGSNNGLYNKIDKSALLTVIGIVLLFSTAVGVTVFAPLFIEDVWVTPASTYQIQMYEEADPNVYFSAFGAQSSALQAVHHVKEGETLLSFSETEAVRIIAPPALAKYITRFGETNLKLTSRPLMLRQPSKENTTWNASDAADTLQEKLQAEWVAKNPNWKEKRRQRPRYTILELCDPGMVEYFSNTEVDGITENWVDRNYSFVDVDERFNGERYREGVLYLNNPQEYRITRFASGPRKGFEFDPNGSPIASLDELQDASLGFVSRQYLIQQGELMYAQEGCHYCHTDQSRTLVQDTILNGSDSYPAPPSSPNEYVYQEKTFMGTRRIGPDLSRVGIKRPHRDWHKSHFWAPKTASAGSIMPRFQHFFDNDPRGTSKNPYGVPNFQFEAMYQYLMTKGTRITPPTMAWWTGDDPIRTIDIIEGRGTAR